MKQFKSHCTKCKAVVQKTTLVKYYKSNRTHNYTEYIGLCSDCNETENTRILLELHNRYSTDWIKH